MWIKLMQSRLILIVLRKTSLLLMMRMRRLAPLNGDISGFASRRIVFLTVMIDGGISAAKERCIVVRQVGPKMSLRGVSVFCSTSTSIYSRRAERQIELYIAVSRRTAMILRGWADLYCL